MRACRLASNFITRRALASIIAPMHVTTPIRFNGTDPKKDEAPPAAEGEQKQQKVEDVDDKIAALTKELEERVAEATDLKKQVQYALAEAENARRIAKIDIDKARDYSVTAIAKDMLEVADTLGKAVDAFAKLDKETETKASHVLTGIKMSLNVMTHNLSRHGIEKIAAAKGQKFDPTVHDAICNAPATEDTPAETIAFIVKDGYMIKDRVLRAAQVGVAKPPD